MDLGSLGFWLFIAAIVVGGYWRDARQKAEKHETLRRILEKTGTIDEAALKELFTERPSQEWKPGSGYRALRVMGTIVMFIAAAILVFFSLFAALAFLFGQPPTGPSNDVAGILAIFSAPAGIAMVGYGLFFSSRFAEPPPGSRNEPTAR